MSILVYTLAQLCKYLCKINSTENISKGTYTSDVDEYFQILIQNICTNSLPIVAYESAHCQSLSPDWLPLILQKEQESEFYRICILRPSPFSGPRPYFQLPNISHFHQTSICNRSSPEGSAPAVATIIRTTHPLLLSHI